MRPVSILRGMAGRSAAAVDTAIRGEAFAYMRAVVESFREQGKGKSWSPINIVTRELRRGAAKVGGESSGGTKALVRTGSLRRSIKVHKRSHASYFVGVHRSAPRSRGLSGKAMPLVNVAQIHETGMVVIPITDKMRRFFRWLFWKGVLSFPWPPKSKRFILIPRRSFLADTMKAFAKGHEARVVLRYRNALLGIKGKVT
jgi:hypothetical protein